MNAPEPDVESEAHRRAFYGSMGVAAPEVPDDWQRGTRASHAARHDEGGRRDDRVRRDTAGRGYVRPGVRLEDRRGRGHIIVERPPSSYRYPTGTTFSDAGDHSSVSQDEGYLRRYSRMV